MRVQGGKLVDKNVKAPVFQFTTKQLPWDPDHLPFLSWKRLACERRYIEVADGPAERPAPTRDLLVSVVRFGDYLGWAELAVDDGTGRVVRVERSR